MEETRAGAFFPGSEAAVLTLQGIYYLVEDAVAHGWQREVERHQCARRRLEQLLTDLGEPIEGPEAPD